MEELYPHSVGLEPTEDEGQPEEGEAGLDYFHSGFLGLGLFVVVEHDQDYLQDESEPAGQPCWED